MFRPPRPGIIRVFAFLLLSLSLAYVGLGQAQSAPPSSAPAATQQKPDQGSSVRPDSKNDDKKAKPSAGGNDADSGQDNSSNQDNSSDQEKPDDDKSAKPDSKTTETKITPQQAEQLFHEVDTILDFASKDTDLPIKHGVKRRLINRDEVVSYLKKNMAEDKDVQRLRRTELVLKKFGLLPKDFNLQSFLVDLLEEQVAGYYDAKTKTVNLLDWVSPELQRPVLAHELTHALQDQNFGLDKWLKKGSDDLDSKRNLTPDDITKDENSEARQAVVEGQAMVTLLDYMLAPMHRNVSDSPEIVDMLNEDMQTGTPDSVQFKNAPIFLKESLTFPYRYGVEFEAEVLRAQGKQKALPDRFRIRHAPAVKSWSRRHIWPESTFRRYRCQTSRKSLRIMSASISAPSANSTWIFSPSSTPGRKLRTTFIRTGAADTITRCMRRVIRRGCWDWFSFPDGRAQRPRKNSLVCTRMAWPSGTKIWKRRRATIFLRT